MAAARVRHGILFGVMTLLLASSASAETSGDAFLKELRATMRALRGESVLGAEGITGAYAGRLDLQPLTDRGALQRARAEGRIESLPADALVLNVRPRLGGLHPIGERDLQHQRLYVGADAAALGCLLHVAARVRSAPLEVTSLVRHLDYQRQLQRTNHNAATALPVHTLGLAFDISVLNVPLRTTREIRDVLRAMRDAGDLFFIAETRQLVFHVVPAPGRLQFYRELFAAMRSLPAPPAVLGVERNLLAAGGIDATPRQAWGASWRPTLIVAAAGLGLLSVPASRRRRRLTRSAGGSRASSSSRAASSA